jgi:hypothetical protein
LLLDQSSVVRLVEVERIWNYGSDLGVRETQANGLQELWLMAGFTGR